MATKSLNPSWVNVTTPTAPFTLVTTSVGVCKSVKSFISPAVPPLCIYDLFSSVLTTTSPSCVVNANIADWFAAVCTVVSATGVKLFTCTLFDP